MKVLVKPVVVGGLDRGGEDLFLKIVARQVSAPTFTEPLEVKLYRGDDAPYVEVTRKKGGSVKYTTFGYEFTWQGVPEDVLKLTDHNKVTVESRLRDPKNWRKVQKFGEGWWEFSHKHFVAGNAD